MYYLIYKITNTINNKIYIGKHCTNNKNDNYFGSGTLLLQAIEKYGIKKFTKEIILECNSEEELDQKEREIVNEEFIARLDTYNIRIGGTGGGSGGDMTIPSKTLHILMKDEEWKKEWQQKIKAGLDLYYQKNPGAMKRFFGKQHTEETKKIISRSKKGKGLGASNSQYGTCWITKNGINKKILKTDLIKYTKQGWFKGRVL
jgi:hypothetical protein